MRTEYDATRGGDAPDVPYVIDAPCIPRDLFALFALYVPCAPACPIVICATSVAGANVRPEWCQCGWRICALLAEDGVVLGRRRVC